MHIHNIVILGRVTPVANQGVIVIYKIPVPNSSYTQVAPKKLFTYNLCLNCQLTLEFCT